MGVDVAVILAGGRAQRLGGIDKTRLDLAGHSALDRVIAACPPQEVVVVGPEGPLPHGVHRVLEDPPFGGPLAGLACGVQALPRLLGPDVAVRDVLVLGGDMPLLTRALLARLLAAGDEQAPRGVRTVVDATGHVQYLCSAWPQDLLTRTLAAVERPEGGWRDLGLRRLYGALTPDQLHVLGPVDHEIQDLDTAEDLARMRALAGGQDAAADSERSGGHRQG